MDSCVAMYKQIDHYTVQYTEYGQSELHVDILTLHVSQCFQIRISRLSGSRAVLGSVLIRIQWVRTSFFYVKKN